MIFLITILAEKPSQANSYAEAFSNVKKKQGYYEISPCSIFPQGAFLTWGIGHLVELREPHEYKAEWKQWDLKQLPIIPPNGAFQFKASKDKIQQFNIVSSLLKQSELIIIGTDSDREGENIARSIIELSGAGHVPTKRLWINSLEVDEVKRGFKNLKNGEDFISYYHEAQARQIGDWTVGLNASRLYTLLFQQMGIKEVFSVGRVQTPSLKLIYDRQKEIENFKPVPFFEIEAIIETELGAFKGIYKERFSTIDEVREVLKNHNIKQQNYGFISEVKTKTKEIHPPKLHSLSSLQTLANRKYKYSPSQVLKIVQSLYDSPLKLVTYPRTDTQYITENEFNYLKNNLYNYQNLINVHFEPSSMAPNKRYVDNSKVQEHYAIVPTKTLPNETIIKGLSTEQKNIYFEVLKSALAMFHHDYTFDETVIHTNVNQLMFISKGKVDKSLGWKSLYQGDPKEEKEENNDENQRLPNVIKDMRCIAKVNSKEGKTSPPKRYTEGQLINMMKSCGKYSEDQETKNILNEVEGLGTEATRSGIIETLKNHRYIEVKKNIVYVTKKGEVLCEGIEGTLLSKPDMTAIWEGYLRKIGQKKGDKNQFILNIINFTKKLIEDSKKDIVNLNVTEQIEAINDSKYIAGCPSCEGGKIIDRGSFYGCTNYKNGCKQSFPKKKNEKTISKSNIKLLCEKGKSNKIKGFKKKSSDKTFDAYLKLVNGKIEFEFK